MNIRKILKEIRWFEFSGIQKLLLIIFLMLHVTFLFSVSNRGQYGNKFFGIWRNTAWDTSGWIARAGDFYAIYEAGHQAFLGRPIFQTQPAMNFLPKEQSLMRAPYIATFRYPPLLAYTFAALLNIFPPEMCYKLWVIFNELLILMGIYLTARIAQNARTAFFSASAWLCFYPMHIEYYMGQFSFFMGYLIFLCGINLINGKQNRAVFWWGLSIFLKVYTIPFAFYWFLRKKIKLPLIWLCVFGFSTVLYFAIFQSDLTMFYKSGIEGKFYADAKEKTPPALYWGSMGVQRGALAITRLFDNQQIGNVNYPPFWSHYILLLVILFPFPFLAYAVLKRNADPLNVLTMFALSWFFWYFDTWEHHYTMLLPLTALLIASGRIKGISAAIIYIAFAAPSLFFIFAKPETNYLFPHNKSIYFAFETIYYLIKPAGIFLLFFKMFNDIKSSASK